MSIGPILIAAFSDYLYGGNAIGLGIGTVYGIFLPLAAVVLFKGRSAMQEAVEMAGEWGDTEKH